MAYLRQISCGKLQIKSFKAQGFLNCEISFKEFCQSPKIAETRHFVNARLSTSLDKTEMLLNVAQCECCSGDRESTSTSGACAIFMVLILGLDSSRKPTS